MAKNFTDFEKLEGSYSAPEYPQGDTGGYLTGTTNTQTTTAMHLVGYDTDQPHGERQYTIESVLLAASAYHVGLENVTNESKEHMFNEPVFTGQTNIYDLVVENNLQVLGETTQLNTKTFATSAFSIRNLGTTTALKVEQTGADTVAQFWDGDEISLEIADGGKIGILGAATSDYDVTIYGTISAYGPLMTRDHINGRDMVQDGFKLDRIQVNADVTSVALSSVKSDLEWLKANVPNYANVTPDEGFDLLEDGSDYKKLPVLSASNNDFSVEKITSIEYNADVTGDHSGDIILNDVPDGPWTGNATTTFVKVTSAERDRLQTVRGVVDTLHTSDDGGDINKADIVAAYQEGYTHFWSQSDDNDYNNVVKPTLESVRSSVSTTSGDWNTVYTDVSQTSANWNDAYTDMTGIQSRRDAVITEVESNSGDWNTVYTDVSQTSGTWNSAINNTNGVNLPDGQGTLDTLSINNSLSSTSNTYISGSVWALTADDAGAPAWIQGVTETIDVGGTILQFIDGLLVKSYPDPNAP